MRMEESVAPVSEATILEFEAIFRLQLPQDYKEFMLEHNGGRPEDDWVFDFIETGSEEPTSSMVCDFMSFSAEYDSLQNAYKNLIEAKEVPTGLLPIADDPGGNLILMSVAQEDHGKVCFGNHELEDPETGYIVFSPIADSFTAFINSLHIDNPE